MTKAISRSFHSQRAGEVQKNPEIDEALIRRQPLKPLDKIIILFGKYIDLICLPLKGTATVLNWAKILPLSKSLKSYIGNQHSALKVVTSTFNLPKFFVNQRTIYEACMDLRKKIANREKVSVYKVAYIAKSIYFNALALTISWIRFPLLLHKMRMIDLGKISKQLPGKLSKSAILLSLASSSVRLIDNVWALGVHVKKDYTSKSGLKKGLSPRTVKALVRASSTGISFTSVSLIAANMFFGLYVAPIALISLSSLSFAASLSSKISRSRDLIWKGRNLSWQGDSSHLPA